jgi:hypothetical protein
MKHLKIYFAVLFFSFLGATQNQLFAQEPAGSWTRTFGANDTLSNGDYRAFLEKQGTNPPRLILKVIKASDKSAVSAAFVWELDNLTFYNISFKTATGYKPEEAILYQVFNTQPPNTSQYSLSKASRHYVAGDVLNKTEEVTPSAYIKLEDDGKVVIYSGTGGVPIVTLGKI